MDIKEAAALLDGREYTKEITRDEEAALRASGLVAVFGASDDLVQFRGTWRDEEGCYNGGTGYVNEHGLIKSRCEEGDECPYFKDSLSNARTIEIVWGEDGFSWLYLTEIPHETFVIMEDDETYCRGIVFAARDAA